MKGKEFGHTLRSTVSIPMRDTLQDPRQLRAVFLLMFEQNFNSSYFPSLEQPTNGQSHATPPLISTFSKLKRSFLGPFFEVPQRALRRLAASGVRSETGLSSHLI